VLGEEVDHQPAHRHRVDRVRAEQSHHRTIRIINRSGHRSGSDHRLWIMSIQLQIFGEKLSYTKINLKIVHLLKQDFQSFQSCQHKKKNNTLKVSDMAILKIDRIQHFQKRPIGNGKTKKLYRMRT
jgi:hypothetical protein